MNKKIYIAIILILLVFKIGASQGYSVISYQKINETNGGFTGDLDNEDSFGVSMDYISDLDGNGYNDLVVGAFTDDDGGSNRGAIYILFLDENNTVIESTKISDTNGGFTGVLDNEDRFGGAVSFLGDLNNDGLIEIAVGADYDGDGGFWHGAVWILSINTDGTVSTQQKISDTEGGFTGVISADAIFGTDIENIGDLNGDGIEDLVVGSRRDDDGGTDRGAVWILFMNADLTVNTFQKISDTDGGFTGVLEFSDYFGGSVANIGDLNGDGTTDIIVGAYRDDDGQTNSGSFYVLFLNTDGTVINHQKISNTTGNLGTNISSEALFGESIDGVFDFDNDGKIEVVVGAMKQVNVSSSLATGAFYIIELNTDGTVSETSLYTNDSNCFTGDLNDGDLFGGSVSFSILNGNSIAAGAYRDSENGYRRGAIWILNIGDSNDYEINTVNPSVCGSFDGSVILSGFTPNISYTVTFDYDGTNEVWVIDANNLGEVILTDLGVGLYENINVSESMSLACSFDLGTAQLDLSNWTISFSVNSQADCNTSNGSILISNLAPNTSYTYSYFYDSVMYSDTFTSNSAGEFIITELSAGDYETLILTDNTSNCTDEIDLIIIEGTGLNAGLDTVPPTLCGAPSDGSIIINNLTESIEYTITYNVNGTSQTVNMIADASGEVYINNLGIGEYTNITIIAIIAGCSQNLDDVIFVSPTFDYSFVANDVSNCGASDGSIVIAGLFPNSDYDVSYDYNGNTITDLVLANAAGEIIISNLSTGNYENITASGVTDGCTDTELLLVISSNNFSASIAFQQPTSCNSNDGTVTISGLINNTNYNIDYIFEGETATVNSNANSSGEIIISNLESGDYEAIVITETVSNCSESLGTVLLETQMADYIFSHTPQSNCIMPDGTIVVSNAVANESYMVSYEYNSNVTNSVIEANSSGEIIISGLEWGNYSSVTATNIANGCMDSIDLIVIEEDTLTGTIYYDCNNLGNGIIGFSGLISESEYTINYTFNGVGVELNAITNTNGLIEVTNLDVGTYTNIHLTEISTGCDNNFPDQELICMSMESEKCFETKDFFTPNNDGKNDYWSLETVTDDCTYKVIIYNRYGKLIKILTNAANKWDGLYKGALMPSSDYWYTVEYKYNTNTAIYKSHFTLKR